MPRWKTALIFTLALLALWAPVQGEMPLSGWQENQAYQYVLFGAYPQGENGERQPVLWRVLRVEEGAACLLSHWILDVRRVHGDQRRYAGFADSELNQWLQDSFLLEAFEPQEREVLREDPQLGRVTLPSVEDLRDERAGFVNNKSRYFYGTPYADSQGLFVYMRTGHSPVYTRTPSQRRHAQRATKTDGTIGYIGVESGDLGVVPLIWLETQRVSVTGGTGSVEDPFLLTLVEEATP